MPDAEVLAALRGTTRDHYLAEESALAPRLVETAALSEQTRSQAQKEAADFVRQARSEATRSGLIDKFLQEYGLSTAEGVTLMRLAEALLRTPDATTASALIEDKIEAGDWASHKGKSPFPLVNVSTRALMLTAAWLDEVEAKDPLGRMAAATKAALDRLGEPVIRASVAQAMRIMGEHFVLGETIDAAMVRAKKFPGYLFSYDMLGEAAHTEKDAQKYFDEYASAIDAIAVNSTSDNAADNPGISVKLSALHPRYEYGKKTRVLDELGERARALALKARAANMGFNIDAEEADRLDLSLDLIEAIMRDGAFEGWSGFGVVVQAYQRRAPFVIDWLGRLARDTGRGVMVRLVKGAYWDSEIKRAQVMGLESYPVYTRKVLTDVSYLACARKLFENADVFYPQFATHNALTATTVMNMGRDCTDYELQRLHGMGEALHDSLIEHGARSRVYAPVGGHKELLPYLVRRLLENGANSSFVNQLIDPDLSVDDVVADPLDELAAINVIANPAIPAPRDHLNGRLAAKGWDETHPPTAAELVKAVSEEGPVTARSEAEKISRDLPDLIEQRNPTTGTTIGWLSSTSETDIDAACMAAQAAQPDWAARNDRSDLLRKAADLLETHANDFMRIATQEAGKTIPDAIAEVREAVDFLRYYADEVEKLDAAGAPLGVVACVSPWNFPLAIFLGQVSAALAAGNAVVCKPAEQTPAIAGEAVRLMHMAGIPEDVLSIVYGDGPSVGASLTAHPAVNGVVFTGSTAAAQAINRNLIANGKHDAGLIAETGGINAMIVDSTALLEQAVTDTVASAFQSAGQRCSACRVACVQEDVADRFNEMLAGAMAELSVGDPSTLSTDVGPVIDEEAHSNITRHIERLERSATRIAQAPEPDPELNGTFIRPVAFEIGSLGDLKAEIFGPVLHVVRFKADELESLVDDINALGFGLTMGLHSRIDETMEAISRRARIGNIYVNRNQIGAVVGVQPFGGEGLSGTGPKAGGPHYLHALRKRPEPIGDGDVSIAEVSAPACEAVLSSAYAAFGRWSRTGDRGAVLQRAVDAATTDSARETLRAARLIFERDFAETETLPGPTGESNTLRLRGRGIILCLGGGDEQANAQQIILALAAGNAVLCTNEVSGLAQALEEAGAPTGLIQYFDAAPKAVLDDDRVRAVVFDGGGEGRKQLSETIAARTGPIIPILTSLDQSWRFAAERALTINTTAAGGDVRLLSLSD